MQHPLHHPNKQTTTSKPAKGDRTKKAKLRRRIIILFLALCTVPITAILLTRTPVLKQVALASIENALDCVATAKSVRLSPNGTLTFEQLELTNPKLNNDAASFFYAEQLDVKPEWTSLTGDSVRFQRVQIREPIITISIDDQNTLNLAGLKPPSGGASTAYPDLTFTNATIQFAEHTNDNYKVLTTVNMDGKLKADPSAPRIHHLELKQIDLQPDESHAVLTGTLDSRTGELDILLQNVDIQQWSSNAAPTHLRDLWSRMNVQGRIDSAELQFDPRTTTLSTIIRPEGITLALPIKLPDEIYQNSPCGLTPSQAREFIELNDVSGTLEFTNVKDVPDTPVGLLADITGSLQGVPAKISLEYRGTDINAPFTTSIQVGPTEFRNPCEIISFAPNIAVEIYDRFAGRDGDGFKPTGIIQASVDLDRLSPGADIKYDGRVDISEGKARFETVPYLFEQVNGSVTFNTERVEILPFTAVAQSGAKLEVSGSIVPPGDGAQVDIAIGINEMPVDREFISNLPDSRRPLVESIISYEEHDRLVREGFVQTAQIRTARLAAYQQLTQSISQLQRINPDDPEIADLIARAEALRERANVPVFEPTGTADLQVTVHRPMGMESTYSTTIIASLKDLALLPKPFPYPAVASNVELTISPTGISLQPATLIGLSGAKGNLYGTVTTANNQQTVIPDVTIDAGEVPVDALLIQALPGEPYREPTESVFEQIFPVIEDQAVEVEDLGPIEFSVQRFLTTLNIDGKVNAKTKLRTSTANEDDLGFTTTVTLNDITASPQGTQHPLQNLSGTLTITERDFKAPDIQATIDEAKITAVVNANFPETTDAAQPVTELSVQLSAIGIDVKQRFEAFLHTIEPARAEPIEDLRERFDPSGTLDVEIDLALIGDQTDYTIQMTNARCIRYNAFGGRVSVTQTANIPSKAILTPDRVSIEQSTGEFRYVEQTGTHSDSALDESESQGTVTFKGQYPTLLLEQYQAPTELNIQVQRADFASTFVQNIAESVAPALAAWLEDVQFEGQGSAQINVTARNPTEPVVDGSLHPTNVKLVQRGTLIELNEIDADIALNAIGGPVVIRSASSSSINQLSFKGNWIRDLSRGVPFGVQGHLDATNASVTDDVLAALPLAAETAVRALEISEDTTLNISNATIDYLVPTSVPGAPPESGFDGQVQFSNANFLAGLNFTDATGTAHIRVTTDESAVAPEVEIDADINTLTLEPVSINNAYIKLRSPKNDPSFYIPTIEATAHNGVAAGNAAVFSTPDPSNPSRFVIDLTFTNIDTAALLEDLGIEDQTTEPNTPYQRGILDGAVSIQGIVGDINSRSGRLVLRAQRYRQRTRTEEQSTQASQQYAFPQNAIIDIPQIRIVVNAVLATSKPPFVVPAVATLVGAPAEIVEFAYAQANIIGPRIAFSDISLETKSTAIKGAGDITLPQQALNLRFTSFELTAAPIISEWVRGVRDQFIAVEISGTLEEPKIEPKFFKAGGEFLDAIFLGREPRNLSQDTPPPPQATR